ncbi:hypothetical protein BG004_003402, partial [Podila humilis]
MNPSLRMFSLLMSAGNKAQLWDTCMEDISMVHLQNNITHLLWSHSGNFFTSVDDKGKIVIWANKRYLNAWLPVYMVVLDNPIVCCEWVNPDRMYIASKADGATTYERERTGRPRSPLALVLLTSDGQVTSIFKPAGQYFTHLTTHLPRRQGGDDFTSSRISHGSMLSDAGGIHLATHTCDILPLTVNFYKIDLQFTPDVIFRCDPMAILHVSNPLTGSGSVMTPSIVQYLCLLPHTSTRPCSIAVALGSREQISAGSIRYTSQVVLWHITSKVIGFHPAFQELSTRRNDAAAGQPSLTLVMFGERQFENKFVTCLTCVPRSRELVVGFSDGTVLGLESRFSGLLDSTSTLLDGFKRGKKSIAVVALQPSPNGYSLLASSLDGHIDIIPTMDTTGCDIDVDSLVQSAVLALLNEWDYTDIVSVLLRAIDASNDQELAEKFMEGIFKSYDFIKGAEDSSMLEPFMPRSSIMRRMLAFQLVLFQSIPQKIVQYRATNALLHLQSIGEVFMGCCISKPDKLAAHLDTNVAVGTTLQQLAFQTDSLWSLFPLSGWVLDFCTVLFKDLAIFLNMKTAGSSRSGSSAGSQPQSVPDNETSPQSKDQHTPTSPSTPPVSIQGTTTLLCFLYNHRARKSLRSVLTLVEQYHQYIRIQVELYMRVVQTGGAIEANATNPELNNHTNSMSLAEAVAMKEIHLTILSQYVQSTFMRCPIKIEATKAMLRDLNGLSGAVPAPTTAVGGGANVITSGTAALNGSLDTSPADHNLEPANPLVKVKSGSKQRVSSIHPSRCRIDTVAALRTRPSNANSSLFAGRVPPPGLQHHASTLSNISMGSRGSISGGITTVPTTTTAAAATTTAAVTAGRQNSMTRIFTESPGELPLSQQVNQQLRSSPQSRNSIGREGSESSTMATLGSFSGVLRDHQQATMMTATTTTTDESSVWGMVCESDSDDSSDDKDKNTESDHIRGGTVDDRAEYLQPIWQQWHLNLKQQHQGERGQHDLKTKQLSNRAMMVDNTAETVPDDDMMQQDDEGVEGGGEEEEDEGEDAEDEEEQEEEEEEEESDEEQSHQYPHQHQGQGGLSRRSSGKGNQFRRSSSANTNHARSSLLLPQWLVQESRSTFQRTRVEWTVFPVLNVERENAIVASADLSRKGLQGLLGHNAPIGFDVVPKGLLQDRHHHPHQQPVSLQIHERQSMIESQVRKRRFGTDMIRKVKKYKTAGLGRQCA